MENQKNPTIAVSIALPALAAAIEDALSEISGQRVPFVLALQVDNVAQYVSNTERADGKSLLANLLKHWEANRTDIPAHYNPDLKP